MDKNFTNDVIGRTDSGIPVRGVEGGGGSLTPEALTEVLKGSDNITVDLSEDEETVVVDLDQDVKDAINGNNEMTITLTEDDWNEEDQCFEIEALINNTYFKIENSTSHTEYEYVGIKNPYFKGMSRNTIDTSILYGFSGLTSTPENRIFQLLPDGEGYWFAVFNGLITQIDVEV